MPNKNPNEIRKKSREEMSNAERRSPPVGTLPGSRHLFCYGAGWQPAADWQSACVGVAIRRPYLEPEVLDTRIPNLCIRNCSVDLFIPSLAAAPSGPETTPLA